MFEHLEGVRAAVDAANVDDLVLVAVALCELMDSEVHVLPLRQGAA